MANSVPTGQTNLAEDVMATMMLRIMLVTQACKNMTSSIQKHQSKRLCWVLPIGKQLTFPALPNGAWPASSRAARGTRVNLLIQFFTNPRQVDRGPGCPGVHPKRTGVLPTFSARRLICKWRVGLLACAHDCYVNCTRWSSNGNSALCQGPTISRPCMAQHVRVHSTNTKDSTNNSAKHLTFDNVK